MYQIPIESITHAEMLEAINSNFSVKGVLAMFGWPPHVTYYNRLRQRCQELEISLPKYSATVQTTYTLEDILKPGVRYDRTRLKKRLIVAGLLVNQCYFEDCPTRGFSNWRGEPLILHLDHINGVSDDNTLSNLRLLCPNCHTQTETWCGKKNTVTKPAQEKITKNLRLSNAAKIKLTHDELTALKQSRAEKTSKLKICPDCGAAKSKSAKTCQKCFKAKTGTKITWPDKATLLEMLSESNFVQVGKVLGVSDNAIRKHLGLK